MTGLRLIFKADLPKRKPTRMHNFDYNSKGAYFITICTQDRKQILSKIAKSYDQSVGDGAHDIAKTVLSHYGKIVEKYILSTENIKGVEIDSYIIMPNHIHMIIIIRGNIISNGMSKAPSPTNAMLSHIVSALKRFCNKEIGHNIFQRSFHDHIIRNISDYNRIAKYIYENPLLWEQDCFYTEN